MNRGDTRRVENKTQPSSSSSPPPTKQEEMSAVRDGIFGIVSDLVSDPKKFVNDIINDYFNDFLTNIQNSGAFSDAEFSRIDSAVDNVLTKIKITSNK